jgi:hypothetical protein
MTHKQIVDAMIHAAEMLDHETAPVNWALGVGRGSEIGQPSLLMDFYDDCYAAYLYVEKCRADKAKATEASK